MVVKSCFKFSFAQSVVWVKKGNELFDVSMGSYDGAETCELVGQYLLNKMENFTINVMSEFIATTV